MASTLRLLLFCSAILLAAAMPVGADEASDPPDVAGHDNAPAIDIPIFPRSLPANPWLHEAPPIEVVLLIIPTVRDDIYFTSGTEWYRLMRMFEVASPARVATVNQEFYLATLRSVVPFGHGDRLPHDPEMLDIFRRLYAPTHLLETFVSDEGDSRVTVARLHTSEGTREYIARNETDALNANVAEIREWLCGEIAHALSPHDLEALRRPLHGLRINTEDGPAWTPALYNDATNPLWEEILAESPWAEYLFHRRASAALANNRRDLHPSMVPPPGDGTVGPLYLMARAWLVNALGQKETALHDYEICIAYYPGATSQARVFLNQWGRDDLTRHRLVGVFERWHRHMPPAPAWDLQMARAHLIASEAWLAPGVAESRQTSRARFTYHNDEAVRLINRAHAVAGPMPQTLELAQRATYPSRNIDWYVAMFHSVAREYPESMAAYRSTLRLMLSFGSREDIGSSRAFITQTMEKRHDWIHAVQLLDDYLLGFGSVRGRLVRDGVEGEISGNRLRGWIADHPEWKEVHSAAAQHILRNDPSPSDVARAAGFAWLAHDDGLLRDIVAAHPRLIFQSNRDFGAVATRGAMRSQLLFAMRRAGHIDEALEFTTDFVEGSHDWLVENMSPDWVTRYYSHHATFLELAGRVKEADVYWEKSGYREDWQTWRTLTWALNDHRIDEARSHIARLNDEGRRVSEVTLAEVMLFARYIGVAEARALVESRNLHTRSDYPLVHRLYHQAIGEPIVAMAGEDE